VTTKTAQEESSEIRRVPGVVTCRCISYADVIRWLEGVILIADDRRRALSIQVPSSSFENAISIV